MSDPNETNTPQRRRMSLVEMFNPRPNISTSPPAGVSASPDTAQHKRGTSISTLGLAGSSQGPSSPYNAFARQRRASISTSSASGSPEFRNSFGDEPAVIEEDDSFQGPANGSPSSPSFARRVSFGAQALRDVRQTNTGASNGGRRPSSSLYTLDEDGLHRVHPSSRSSETAKAGGEGFNWTEAFRDRTKRSPSFSSGNPFSSGINRSKSTGAPPVVEPPKEMPRVTSPPAKLKKPDHLGERMLRGDFMMD